MRATEREGRWSGRVWCSVVSAVGAGAVLAAALPVAAPAMAARPYLPDNAARNLANLTAGDC